MLNDCYCSFAQNLEKTSNCAGEYPSNIKRISVNVIRPEIDFFPAGSQPLASGMLRAMSWRAEIAFAENFFARDFEMHVIQGPQTACLVE